MSSDNTYMQQSMFSPLELTSKNIGWLRSADYEVITDKFKLKDIFDSWDDSTRVSWDIESEGLSPIVHKIVGMSFSDRIGSAFYVPLRHKFDRNMDLDTAKELIIPVLQTKFLIAHNGLFDWKHTLSEWGIKANVRFDTMLAMYCLDPNRGPMKFRSKMRLDHLVKEFFGVDMLEISDLLGKGVYDFSLVKLDDAKPYACGDADGALRLYSKLKPLIIENDLADVFKIEMRTMPLVGLMELTGVLLDGKHFEEANLTGVISDIEDSINAEVGRPITLSSPKDISWLLFDHLKLDRVSGDSTDIFVLNALEDKHSIVSLIKQHRELSTLQNDFVSKLPEVVAEDGRVHTSFSQIGTRSGRFTSSGGCGKAGAKLKVNLQQLPKRSRVNVRKGFIPTPGHLWARLDFSQIEYRIMAYASGEKSLIDAYRDGIDFHTKTASEIFRVPIDQVTDTIRNKGKTCNFAIMYGQGPAGLARGIKCNIQEAKNVIGKYFSRLPRVKMMVEEKKDFARKHSMIRTMFGRWRKFDFTNDEKTKERLLMSAFNTFVQGTAADINKIALGRVWDIAADVEAYVNFLTTVHDELNFEINYSAELGPTILRIANAMHIESPFEGWLDFPVDVEVGFNYGELSSVDMTLLKDALTLKDIKDLIEESKKKKPIEEKEEYAPIIVKKKQLLSTKILPPSVVVSSDTLSDITLSTLKEVANSFAGNHNLFIKIDSDTVFRVEGTKVNPSSLFVSTLEQVGFKISVYDTSARSFDSSRLSFRRT